MSKLPTYMQPRVCSWICERSLLIKKTPYQVRLGILVHHNVRTQDIHFFYYIEIIVSVTICIWCDASKYTYRAVTVFEEK